MHQPPRTARSPYAAVLAGLLLVTAGCGSESGTGDTAVPSPDLDGVWTLTAAPFDLLDTHPITLTLDGDKASGRSACNSYSGAVAGTADTVAFSGLAGTEMACSPASVMHLEQTYLAALQSVGTATRTGDVLTLDGPAGTMTFAPEPPVADAPLAGTRWRLDSILAGDTASSVLSAGVGIRFADDGSVRGSTGCRDFSGSWRRTGDRIALADLVWTPPVPCTDRMAEQDGVVLGVLETGSTASVEGRLLTLSGHGGAGLVYRAG